MRILKAAARSTNGLDIAANTWELLILKVLNITSIGRKAK